MIIKKQRRKSYQQFVLEILDKRMRLPGKEKHHLLNIQKGFAGELKLDSIMMKILEVDGILLNDLMFTNKGSTFQVDSFLITGVGNYLLEVKNYEGNFQFKNGNFLTYSEEQLTNPLTKVSTTGTKMSHLLKSWNFKPSFTPKLVFINPLCMIYNAPIDNTIVYPSQITRFFSKLNQQPFPLAESDYDLADKLLSEHQSEAAFSRKMPAYTFEALEKTMWCLQCHAKKLSWTQRSCRCDTCGYKSTVDEIFISHAEEFKLLFPDMKMTTNVLYQWTGKLVSVHQIQRILNKYYKKMGLTRGSFYK